MEPMKVDTYRGIGISLSPYGKFIANWPDPNEEGKFNTAYYDTYEACKNSIDRHLHAEKKARKLTLPVLAVTGVRWGSTGEYTVRPATITGINLHTQEVTTTPAKLNKYSFYPRVAWVSDHVERLRVLSDEMTQLLTDLEAIQIDGRRGVKYRPWGTKASFYTGHLDEDNYEEALDSLVKEHHDRVNVAEMWPVTPTEPA